MDAPLLRRAEPRISLKMFVKLSDPVTGAFEITSTINVSCHGARIVTKNLWGTNRDLFVQPIRGSLPSRGRELARVPASAVCRRGPDHVARVA